jgi:hypothetical protein
MVQYPIKRCYCKKIASKTFNGEFYCEMHASSESFDIQNICTICCNKAIKQDAVVCDTCTISTIDNKTIKTKTKELEVKKALEDAKINIARYDKTIAGGCSKRRPDFYIETDAGTIVLEVDEFQHQRSNYPCECEITRMKQIYHDIGLEDLRLLFIRYNPDKYQPSYGSEYSNLRKLKHLVEYIQHIKTIEVGLTVTYMFYNGFTQLQEESEKINPYASEKIKVIINKRGSDLEVCSERLDTICILRVDKI